jgi:hypothetical protein
VSRAGTDRSNINLGAIGNGQRFRVAVAWAAADKAASLDGAAVKTAAGSAPAAPLTTLRLGSSFTGEHWSGWIEDVVHVPGRTADGALQAQAVLV